MKFNLVSTSLLAGLAAHVLAQPNELTRRRTTSLFIDPPAIPDLPTAPQAKEAAAAASLNLDNIQGDILVGMKKKKELFFFFSIMDTPVFKTKLRSNIAPLITTTTQLLSVSTQPTTAVNIAFSQTGLTTLNITDNLGDAPYTGGQFADAGALGDDGTANWVPGFAGTGIHGVFILASDTVGNINTQLAQLQTTLGASIKEVHRLQGESRPGSEEGHEHFGFMDGISQPAVIGFNDLTAKPGQTPVNAGVILFGAEGDTITRPTWTKDGSFLAFRQLKQLVPEFNKFLADNPIVLDGFTSEQGSELLGARMVGRWKSGAPIDLTPLKDDPTLAADANRNNNFTFNHTDFGPGLNLANDQTRCPFSAHIRKTRPRADLGNNVLNHIIRAGIPYGPEVTSDERSSNKTTIERGLAFVSYQSQLNQGFRFIQRSWANTANFVFGKNDTTPGHDPIIGAVNGRNRTTSGLILNDPNRDLSIPDFIVSRGGEYFFSPSVEAISTTLSA